MACAFCDDDDDRLISDDFAKTAVMELAAAIALSGNRAAAMALDVVFRDDPTFGEWISQARNGRMAKAA